MHWKNLENIATLLPFLTLLIGYFLRELSHWLHVRFNTIFKHRAIADDLIFPLVRVADELVGRTYHHIRSDFRDGVTRTNPINKAQDQSHLYDLYLWARFWAHTSRIRKNILSYRLSNTKDGRVLLEFLDCLESSKVSIVPRPIQRLVGDAYIDEVGLDGGGSYFTFVRKIQDNSNFSMAIEGINTPLISADSNKRARQKLLSYTIAIHTMVDYLDKKRRVSTDRRALSNKLDKRTRDDLGYRVLSVYTPLSREQIRKYVECVPKQ